MAATLALLSLLLLTLLSRGYFDLSGLERARAVVGRLMVLSMLALGIVLALSAELQGRTEPGTLHLAVFCLAIGLSLTALVGHHAVALVLALGGRLRELVPEHHRAWLARVWFWLPVALAGPAVIARIATA